MLVSLPAISASTLVKNCQVLVVCTAWFAACAIPLNSLLFLFRIRAVFNDSKRVIIFFGLLWVVELGCSLSMPFGIRATYVKTLRSCHDTFVADFVSLGPIISWIYDTLVFFAISAKLMSYTPMERQHTRYGRLVSFFSSLEKGRVSRALLQTGQIYYLYVISRLSGHTPSDEPHRCTVGVNLAFVICLLIPPVSSAYRGALAVPDLVLQNVMACRVFRLLSCGHFCDGVSCDTVKLPTIHTTIEVNQSINNAFDGEVSTS